MNRQEIIKGVVDAVLECAYGDTIPHSSFSKQIGAPVDSNIYRGIIEAVKKQALEMGRMLESVRGVGYRVVRPGNYIDHGVRHMITGARRIDKGAKILRCAPTKDMSQEELARYNQVNDHYRMVNAFMKGSKVEVRLLAKPTNNPLKNAQ